MGQIVPTLWACPPSGKPTTSQWARKFKVQTKKLVKSNKSILRPIFFLTKIHFLQFLRWPQKSIFWTAQKCNFTGEKNSEYFVKLIFFIISRDFLPGRFKIFWPVVNLGKILMPYSNSKKISFYRERHHTHSSQLSHTHQTSYPYNNNHNSRCPILFGI